MALEKKSTSLPEFNPLSTDNAAADHNFERIEEILDEFTSRQVNDHILIEDVTLQAGYNNRIIHKLGRVPIGFWFVDCDDFFMYKKVEADINKLTLQVTDTVTCSLVVF
jgi:hypothetical protein